MALLFRGLAYGKISRLSSTFRSNIISGIKYSTSMKDSLPNIEGKIDSDMHYPILNKNIIPEADKKKIQEEVAEETKDWICYGFNMTNRLDDESRYHSSMFFTITIILTSCIFIWSFLPDPKRSAWTIREAYLELERREKNGLPLINPDFVPPEKIWLPSEEELKATSTKIII